MSRFSPFRRFALPGSPALRVWLRGVGLGGGFLLLAGVLGSHSAVAAEHDDGFPEPERSEIRIDVDAQKLRLVRGGKAVASFPISTSRFGLGDDFRSYKTPVGTFQVCSKVGAHLPLGAVLKGGRFTGEVLRPNAPGRDPIVTRIIRLEGLEDGNRNALERGIYIHGTPEERRIGKPVSWGCIRMRSRDVVELYKQVDVGTKVIIRSRKASHGEEGKSRSWLLSWWS